MAPTGLDPAGSSPLLAAVTWIGQVLTGHVATAAAVIAIAFVGFRLLSGDLSIRDGARVVVGCFILFGAPLIAKSFVAAIQGNEIVTAPTGETQNLMPPPSSPLQAPEVPPAQNGNPFDPNPARPQ